ncbi:MAG: cation:proton antiporter [Pseudomonadota bacterium]
MATDNLIIMLSGLLLLAIVVQPLSQRLHLPFTAVLVVTGFMASELLVRSGIDTGIRAENFHSLVFYVFLPVLIFESAYNTDVRLLLRNLLPILFLAIPLMLLSILITAALVYLGIGHPEGFPWIAALLTGALLAATDPIAVVAIFRRLGVPERLALLLEGESLFNDATAIVMFSVFIAVATQTAGPMTIADGTVFFLKVFFGGIIVGGVTGAVFLFVTRLVNNSISRAAATVISAYLAFIVAESLLHVSGVMAVLVAGIILGRSSSHTASADGDFVEQLWAFNAWVANALVFLLMGVTITLGMFIDRWLAMLIGIAAIIIARAIGVFGFVPLLTRLTPVEPIPKAWQTLMFWGGLRGAVTLALALSLPTELEYWWTIQSIAFGVVLFTLFVQATTMAPLIRKYRINK